MSRNIWAFRGLKAQLCFHIEFEIFNPLYSARITFQTPLRNFKLLNYRKTSFYLTLFTISVYVVINPLVSRLTSISKKLIDTRWMQRIKMWIIRTKIVYIIANAGILYYHKD